MELNEQLNTDLYEYTLPIPVAYDAVEEYWDFSDAPTRILYFINDDGTGRLALTGESISIEEVTMDTDITLTPNGVGDFEDTLELDSSVLYLYGESLSSTIVYQIKYLSTVGGNIEGDTPQYIPRGLVGTEVTAVADDGYEFLMWSDGTLTANRTDTPTKNSNYYALFTKTTITENLLGQYSD